jgi:hypothetical protein
MSSYQKNRNQYFASGSAEDVVERSQYEIDNWGYGNTSSVFFQNILKTMRRNINYYYSNVINTASGDSAVEYKGDQGELVQMRMPVARTLIRQFVTLTTKQRLVFECMTDVQDPNPIITSKLGKAICNSLVESQGVDLKMEKIAERVAVLGTYFMSCIWRSDKGYIFNKTEEGNPLYSGDVHFETHDINDVFFDWSIEDFENLDWLILRRPLNRWSLIAQFPDMREAILAFPSARQERSAQTYYYNTMSRMDNDDIIYVREFYHKPTPAVPFGRMTVFLDKEAILYDNPEENPYGQIPVVPFMFEKITNTGIGYPLISSLLPGQQMLDHCFSVVSTNQQAFGVQSVLIPKGSNINSKAVNGLNFIYYTPQSAEGGGKPEPLQLTQTPPEIMQFAQILSRNLGEVSMINDTLRGNPPPNVTSGAMAATLSANALEFLNSASKTLLIGIEKIFNIAMTCYKKFATVEQIIDIVGEGQIAFVREFKAEDLQTIKRVKIRTQSPLMNSISGRLQLGEALMPMLQNNQSSAIVKYLSLLNGAPVDSLFEIEFDEGMAAQQEVDALIEGRNVMPLMTDNHPIFIRELMKLIYNPIVRVNTELSAKITAVIEERVKMELSLDPAIKAMTRGLPVPPMPPPNTGPGSLGGSPDAQPEGLPSAPATPAVS